MSRPFSRRIRPRGAVSRVCTGWIETLEERTLLSAGDPLQVLVGGGAAKSVQFTTAAGVQAKLFVSGPGSATVSFDGTGLSQSANASGLVITGTDVALDSVAVAGSTTHSTLQIVTRKGSISAGGITVTGSLAALKAPGVAVSGDVTLTGWTSQIQLGAARDGTITVGPAHIAAKLALSVGSASDENLNSSIRISSISAAQWVNTTATPPTIQAPQIDTVNVKNGFAAGLVLTGVPGGKPVLTHFSAGAITGGSWTLSGNAGTVQAGSISGWSANVSGSIYAVNVTHDATANLTASTIGSMNVHGTLADSTIALMNPLTPTGFDLGKLSASGGMVSSTIRSIGSIGPVVVGRMQDSQIYAGLVNFPQGQLLPSIATDFTNVAQIKSVTIRKSASASFANSALGAYAIGSANLGTVPMANGGVTFGVGGHSIKLLSFVDETTGKSVRLVNVPSTAAFFSALASKGITQADFVARII